MIEFRCPICKRIKKAPDGSEGKRAICSCGTTLRVPSFSPQPLPPPPPLLPPAPIFDPVPAAPPSSASVIDYVEPEPVGNCSEVRRVDDEDDQEPVPKRSERRRPKERKEPDDDYEPEDDYEPRRRRRKRPDPTKIIILWAAIGAGACAALGLFMSQFMPVFGGFLELNLAQPFSPARLALIPIHLFAFGLLGGVLGGGIMALKIFNESHR